MTGPGASRDDGRTPPRAGRVFAVLGDSIAFGQGAADITETLAARLAAELESDGNPMSVRMLAVPGSRSDALAAQVHRAVQVGPHLALIVVGANDLINFVSPRVAAAQLGAATTTLVQAGVRVVVAPAPDMSSVPWVPQFARPLVHAASITLQDAQRRCARAAGATVVDLSDCERQFVSDPGLFSGDHFHPSGAGYAVIAHALTPALLAAARLEAA